MRFRTLIAILSACLMAGCSGVSDVSDKAVDSFFAMDTYMTITAYGDGAASAADAAKAEILRLDSLWSVTDENSDIYAVNNSNGSPQQMSDDTIDLLEYTLDICEKTSGAIDPTIYPLVEKWGFVTEKYYVPSENEINILLQHVDYTKLSVTDGGIILPEGMMIDLGAVGKGRAGQLAAEIVREHGITSALLDVGGNIQTVGSRTDGEAWRLGLRDPFSDGTIGVISVRDKAVVTSGGYERFFVSDSKEYCHIIDPHSGMPVDNDLASVTVIADNGTLCDALSTALYVMGCDGAVSYWKDNGISDGFDLILITDSSDIYVTEGIITDFALSDGYEHIEVHAVS